MNLGEIRQGVRDDLDEPVAAFWSDALLNRYINRAYKYVRSEIVKIHEGFFERTATGTYAGNARTVPLTDLGLPNQPLSFIVVEDISDSPDRGVPLDHINYMDEHTYRRRSGSVIDASSFKGQGYFLVGGVDGRRELGVRPIPGGGITLRFVFVPQTIELVGDIDVPEVAEDFHEAILLRATILAKKREEAPAQDYERELGLIMNTALLTLEGRHEDNFPRTRVSDPTLYQYDW